MVTETPLLAELPDLQGRAPLAGGHDDPDVLSAARELRQGFVAAGRSENCAGTTYVVGMDQGVGGSTVAFLLARSAAQDGESVVLVDADAEQAWLSARLGLPRNHGLSDVLAQPDRLAEAVQEVHGVPVLGTRRFASAGDDRATQLAALFETASPRWKHVIVDVPAAQAALVAEAATSQDSDVVLVTDTDTSADALRREVGQWQDRGLYVRGVVRNRPVPPPRRPWRRPRRPVVLMYHGFCTNRRDDDPENLFVEVAAFEQQLQWLLAHGWVALDLDGYLDARAGRPTPRKSFLVTIDDAYVSVADLAAPVLRRLDVPALLFVPSGLVGETARWLPTPADEPIQGTQKLRHLQDEFGIEMGSHGVDHRDMRDLDSVELNRQVVEAGIELGNALGRDVRCLAYPFGAHDAAARDAAERAGVCVAFSVFDDAGKFAVSRVDVNATDTLRSFRIKLMPHYRRVWRALQRIPWVRRSIRHVTTFSPRKPSSAPDDRP